MSNDQQMLKRQQVLADFGDLTLRSEDLDEVLTEACRLVGAALGTDRAKVLEIQDGGDELFVRAGVGWAPGVVGHVRLPMSERSSETFSIREGRPVISQDIGQEERFDIPDFMKEAGVVAMVNVPIFLPGRKPYGLLQVDADEPRAFGQDDIEFLRTYTTILGPVIDRLHKVRRLRTLEEQQRMTLRLVPALLWSADPAGDIISADQRWRDQTGQQEAEIHDFSWLDAVHPDDRQATQEAFAHAFATGEPIERQQRIRTADGGHRWHLVRHVPVRDETGAIARWFGAAIDVHELHNLQEGQALLVAELQHRTRNLIAVVRGIADETMDETGPTEAFRAAFFDRLSALSRVQGLLSRAEAEPIAIGALVRLELDTLGAGAPDGRALIEGPEVFLEPAVVQTLALALHELATNARKHGALSHEGGRLAVTWRERAEGGEARLALDWVETGLEQAPDRSALAGVSRGYGRELIEHALPHALGARTRYALTASGVRCSIDLVVRAGQEGDRS